MLNESVIHGFDAAAAAKLDYDVDAEIAAARPDPLASLTGGQADQITIDGDVELARHWVQDTAHVAG